MGPRRTADYSGVTLQAPSFLLVVVRSEGQMKIAFI
jgi:hypothetical protein